MARTHVLERWLSCHGPQSPQSTFLYNQLNVIARNVQQAATERQEQDGYEDVEPQIF